MREQPPHGHSDAYPLDCAIDDIGRQPQTGLLVDADDGDDIGRLESLLPYLPIDGKGQNGPHARHRFIAHLSRFARRADRQRRMYIMAAGLTAVEPQWPGWAGSPKKSIL